MLGASDDLPIQPAEGARTSITLRDIIRLSQDPGARRKQSGEEDQIEGISEAAPSGFTISVPPSEDSQGTQRSSLDFRRALLPCQP